MIIAQRRTRKTTKFTDLTTQDTHTEYDEFQKACKTIPPKVDRKLIEDFLFRQQEDSDTKSRYSLEVITKNQRFDIEQSGGNA